MATATSEIRALTAAAFTTPEKFTQFCRNGGQPLGGVINGKRVRGSMNATFQTVDPGSQEVLATVCEMGEAEVAQAVEAGSRAFHGDLGRGWKDFEVEERIELVNKLVELCDRDRDVLLACEIRDGGKVSELAEGDFTQIRACAEYFCQVARQIKLGDGPAREVSPGVQGYTYREPWGVVAGIIPWNYPIVLTSWFMFPALLAGNSILIKPAEDTPLSALYIAQLAEEAGFPPGVINVLPGRGEITGQCIAEHPGVRFISFTGSPGVGQAILRTCDRHGTRMKREMGGNGAAIVLDDVDPERVARLLGRYTNQHYGQTCCTVHRVFVNSKIASDFIDAQRAFFDGLKIGYQADEGTQLGAVVNPTQRRRILQAQQETVLRGGQAVLAGGVADVSGKDGYYLKPALYRTAPGVDCNPLEVFHTFATVCPVDSAEQALQLANTSPYGLGASVWTKDVERGVALAKQFRDGTCQVNCHNTIAYGLPYGGQGISGGPGGGVNCEDTFRDYTQVKAVYVAELYMTERIELRTGAMPAVGLGTWKIPNDACAELVRRAVGAGYRHFDCACDYGNEREVGAGLRQALSEGACRRDELWVTSKLWNTFHRRQHVEQACKRSLADLQLDYLDLYLIHFPIAQRYVPIDQRYPPGWFYNPDAAEPRMEFDSVPIAETWSAMEELQKAGLVRNLGVCNFGTALLRDLLSCAEAPPAVLQVESHPYLTQEKLLRFCQQQQIAFTAFSPLGALSYHAMGMADPQDSLLERAEIRAIAAAHGRTPAQVLLRWGVQRGTAVVPKTTRLERLEENLAVFEFQLSDEQMASISGLNQNRRYNDPGVFCEAGFNTFCPIYE